MFKKVPTPFKRTKESKKIVGRVVEIEGKEIDKNDNSSNNSLKSSSSAPKSISASVSRIFGASPYKKTSTTRTPGRKLLKKLICTPGKSRSFPDTSSSEIDDFNIYIPNNNTSGLTLSRTTSTEESKETNSVQESNSSEMPYSPPKESRTILADTNSNQAIDNEHTMKSPARAQNHEMQNSIDGCKRIDDELVAASNRSESMDDLIFLSSSTSSDECDRRSEIDAIPSMKSSSPYSSPLSYERQSSPSKPRGVAMRSPGIGIPTPAISKKRDVSNGSYINDFAAPFPDPLRNIHNTPTDGMNATMPKPKNLSTPFDECDDDNDDDDAFLPDDFVVGSDKPKEGVVTYTQEQLEQKIREARREERISLRKQHEKEMEECQNEFEKVLIESGAQWKQDADEQEAKYEKLLKEERHKTSLKHHELINKAQSLQDINDNLKEVEAERELLNLRVRDLETSGEKMNEKKGHELQSLRNDYRNAEQRILELKSELEAFDPLKKEKEAVDRKAAELSEQLQLVKESNSLSESKLEDANEEIALLRAQLEELENLRSLRTEDGKEIQALQTQLSEIVDEHQDALTPQKKVAKNDSLGSPRVIEFDTLRVDYDKAQVQLKAMGKVLKRYKNEKDQLKKTIQELETRHVQAIQIAVQQATQDQKETIQILTAEIDALRQEPKDIGDKMVEEIKQHMEDLKKSHEEEIIKLSEALDNENKNTEEQKKALKAQFDMERKEIKKIYEKQIESLTEESRQLRASKADELALLTSSSKEEVDILHGELRELKIGFENEKIEIIKSKSEECEALEKQIKSMNEMHNEELELVVSESQEEVENLKKKIDTLTKGLDTKSSGTLTEDMVEKMRSDLEATLQEMKEKAKADADKLLLHISSLKEEKDAETAKASKFEAQLVEIQLQHAARVEGVRSEYDRKIREVKSEHASESEELLAQLDLIEAEATQRFKNAEAAVLEKDAVISALGSQLAESESRSAATSKKYDILKKELESLRTDLEVVTASNEASQNKINALIERHKKEMEEQIVLREGACNEAREEMIALAEGQLAERQEYYQALKRELDNAQSKIAVFERDLRFAKKELDEVGKRHEAREADLKDELAQSKAAIAAKDANLTRAEKVHQAELNRVKESERAMKTKFEEAQATSHSVQKTLAALVTEKQRLERELAEVTAISEELATICEKNKLI